MSSSHPDFFSIFDAMKKLLLILLCLPIVVCASFPIPSAVDTPITDTLIKIKTISPESSDTLKSDALYDSGWMTGEESEKYSKDTTLRKMNGNRGSKHFLYINRTFFGLYNLLHDLGAKINVNQFKKYIPNATA
jgi:hypothetical protein